MTLLINRPNVTRQASNRVAADDGPKSRRCRVRRFVTESRRSCDTTDTINCRYLADAMREVTSVTCNHYLQTCVRRDSANNSCGRFHCIAAKIMRRRCSDVTKMQSGWKKVICQRTCRMQCHLPLHQMSYEFSDWTEWLAKPI
ncbi:hypothetical protein EVAR_24650_1 [Eumeta japonica]|uniref:Uncharacterized protein n=1 Tax=Eumeta variegata TaxID=151549 RepID=A0A4C1V2D9_EUMVA|nr:hypothetical protein EVAR_24650_1 [Eumeta japonica]